MFEKYLQEDGNGCLIWTGKKRSNGNNLFPVIIFGPYFKYGKTVAQVMWCYAYKTNLPEDHTVMRTCSNSMCCAPDHLVAVPNSLKIKFSKIKSSGLVDDKIVVPGDCFVTPKLGKWYDHFVKEGKLQVR